MANFYGLQSLSVQGCTTNREFLLRVLAHPSYRDGQIHTHFLTEHADTLLAPTRSSDSTFLSAVAATVMTHEARRNVRTVLPALEPGFRNNHNQHQTVDYLAGDSAICVGYRNLGSGRFLFSCGGREETICIISLDAPDICIEESGSALRHRFRVLAQADRMFVHNREHGSVELTIRERFPLAREAEVEGGCTAPMPGKVVKVMVSEGQQVDAGQTLLILEAMKMEHPVKAKETGVVRQITVVEGAQVEASALLAVIEPELSQE